MKKYLSGLIAVIIAFTAFSFTSAKDESSKINYYWFKLNATNGNPKTADVVPPLQSTDPFGCSGLTQFCAGAYPSYVDNGDGTYSASGTRQITDMKP